MYTCKTTVRQPTPGSYNFSPEVLCVLLRCCTLLHCVTHCYNITLLHDLITTQYILRTLCVYLWDSAADHPWVLQPLS